MSITWDEVEWKNEDSLKKFKQNSKRILDIQLAMEDYIDQKQTVVPSLDEAFKDLHILRHEKTKMSEEELLNLSNKVLKNLEKAIDYVGRENFIFYKNGGLEYNFNKKN